MYNEIKFLPAGDKSLVMEFGNIIDPEINAKIRNVVAAIEDSNLESISELIPTYRSILVIYNPLLIEYKSLIESLKEIANNLGDESKTEARIVELPTVYGGEYGPDIEFVAKHNNITVEEVIKFHSSTDYLLYMLGFTPGFGYLGGMRKEIETPRLQVPRTKIPAGSTGIAGSQTGIYPIDSPGGWQLIGRTPVRLYDPKAEVPILLNAGDYVRFVPISEEEYLKIQEKINRDEYKVNIIKRGDSGE
ncbi:MAG: 5-oxoprolinase subunit PxpB [Tissierellia bacterium]|nr:5-oxoprolinase subunit PxpB [Tissierellia bacterium]